MPPASSKGKEPPFLPLFAPKLGKPDNGKPLVVDWFTRIAPRLEEGTSSPVKPPDEPTRPADFSSKPAAFRDVEEMAEETRAFARSLLVIEEPPELVELRMAAASEADRMIESAKAESAQIEAQARQKGYQEGFAEGYSRGERDATIALTRQADQERAALIQDLHDFLSHIEEERNRIWEEMEPQILSLIFETACRVIKQEVQASKTVALSVIRNALLRVREKGSLEIRVNPRDLETVRSHREQLLDILDNLPNVEIIGDKRVGAGGCIVETSSGSIDARIETQLSELSLQLNQPIPENSSEEVE